LHLIAMSPVFERRLSELSPASDRIWLTGMGIGLVLTMVAAFAPLPAGGGTMCAYLGLLIRGALYLRAGDTLPDRGGAVLGGLMRMGIVAGLFELIVDWWLINGVTNGRLDYLGARDVVLLASPIWMPLAWACVIVELGYPALRLFGLLRTRMNLAGAAMIASLVAGAAAGITVGFYEYFAYLAGWWRYAPARHMIGAYCALFIPVGEAFMFLVILPVAARTFAREDRPVASAIEGGAMFGIAIFAGYAIAYVLLELGRTP
jgi:hypothetical protein